METLGGMMEFQDFEAGTILEEEGKYNAGLYIIIWGTINAMTKKEGDDKLKLLSVMGEGSVMGEVRTNEEPDLPPSPQPQHIFHAFP